MKEITEMMKGKFEKKEEGKIICERRWEGLTCHVTYKAVMDSGREYNIHTIQWGKILPNEIVEQDGTEILVKETKEELKRVMMKSAKDYIDWFVRENCDGDGSLGVKGTLIVAEEVKK